MRNPKQHRHITSEKYKEKQAVLFMYESLLKRKEEKSHIHLTSIKESITKVREQLEMLQTKYPHYLI